ncbi:hypothetical protein BX600DRAFT_512454 [Xylariales sp. PMI_506]|nr:hypothetical protein BX600DRAFT_512454 [Xylariales sp. PMI_506]
MADLNSFRSQTWALIKKNFTIIVIRSWFWTIIRAAVLPILLVTLLFEIREIPGPSPSYDVGDPATIISLAKSMEMSSKKLAIAQEPGLGSDFPEVLTRFTQPLDSSKIVYLSSPNDAMSTCSVDLRGNSNCYAVVTFSDSPLSGQPDAAWRYSIQTDPSRVDGGYDVTSHSGNYETFWYPLQLAIDNAITNTSVDVDALAYVSGDPELATERDKDQFLFEALYILGFVFFLSTLTVVHHVSTMITSERERGLSQLVDAMSGGSTWSRVISYIVTFDILYLPLWVVLGCLFWYLLVPTTSPAITIFWQILTGWAATSASTFGAAFFKKSIFGATVVVGISIILAGVCSYIENAPIPASYGTVVVLGLLFPPMNYVFFLDFMMRAELSDLPTNLAAKLPLNSISSHAGNWAYHNSPYFLWICLIVQIIAYTLLSVLIEKWQHGNNRRNRSFKSTAGVSTDDSTVAIQTLGLEKQYKPSIWQQMFLCARKPASKAVDGLSLTSRKGQILCLLGPNGSGKTTTLDMIAGFQAPTNGSINIYSESSQIGICPQKNILWDDLTVTEHLVLWNTLKSGKDDAAAIDNIIKCCDLVNKKNSRSKNLSGGMKRKLQLACMLVGGSSICLLDEVTSGLDPVSRRVIWNAVLAERSRRTMIFTTHFLDESEVLSDHIMILSLGTAKCEGTPAQLKNEYGGGYRVHLPKTVDISGINYPVVDRGDRYICTTPDSSQASELLALFEESKVAEPFITGPTMEDVFLKVSRDTYDAEGDIFQIEPVTGKPIQASLVTEEVSTPRAIFSRQFGALFKKRFLTLRSQWWVYLFALAIPIIVTHFLGGFLTNFPGIDCAQLLGNSAAASTVRMYPNSHVVGGPLSANQSIIEAANTTIEDLTYDGLTTRSINLTIEVDKSSFVNYVKANYRSLYEGGMFIDNRTNSLLAYSTTSAQNNIAVMNVANIARTGVTIHVFTGALTNGLSYSMGDTLEWSTLFILMQALYPAFFCLYPAYERRSNVRELQYSNGVRALPLWLSYLLFDLMFVLLVSVACVGLIAIQGPFWGLGYFWLVVFLSGIAATITSYIVSTFASSQPAAISWSILIMIIQYVLSIITEVIVQTGQSDSLSIVDGTTYGLGIIFPIQNLVRAAAVSLNEYAVRCRGFSEVTNPGSIYAYGAPIMLLILQICGLFFLLLYLDGTVFSFSRPKIFVKDVEEKGTSGRPDVDAETRRVENSQTDLLRMLHVSKQFGKDTVVDDVSLGMREGEILALLGPNGAGKTTSINMIRGNLSPTSGRILLESVDVHKNKRLAQRRLGVCPQFDALDLLTVQEQLTFYARCKGVANVEEEVKGVMSRVGIAAHTNKLASKLSGGQKRKLSLAIALVGNPPILVLDEPSSAMDAASKRVLWKTLEAVAPGRSVLITTHSMEEADALATRAAIISKRLLAIGTTEELRKTHSNEYHVHIVLKSAPMSTEEEMRRVSDWVVESFPTCNVQFEGESLGGQVRFILPADAEVPVAVDAGVDVISSKPTVIKSMARHLIETLDKNKETLGIDCYSIGAATMERVFLSVVKQSDAEEDEDVAPTLWRRIGLSRE